MARRLMKEASPGVSLKDRFGRTRQTAETNRLPFMLTRFVSANSLIHELNCPGASPIFQNAIHLPSDGAMRELASMGALRVQGAAAQTGWRDSSAQNQI